MTHRQSVFAQPVFDRTVHLCLDCGIDTVRLGEYYMVTDDVWNTATGDPHGHGMLCVACLEHRLGRRLTAADFTSAPINRLTRWAIFSPRLRRRIQTPPPQPFPVDSLFGALR